MTQMAHKTTYSESQIAHGIAMVAAKRGNVTAAARELGIPGRTLYSWVRRERRVPLGEDARLARASNITAEREKLGMAWSNLVYKGIESLHSRIEDGSLGDRELVGVAVAGTDKILALLGPAQPQTSVTINLAQLFRAHADVLLPTIDVEPLNDPQ